jgi:hypothetical protein
VGGILLVVIALDDEAALLAQQALHLGDSRRRQSTERDGVSDDRRGKGQGRERAKGVSWSPCLVLYNGRRGKAIFAIGCHNMTTPLYAPENLVILNKNSDIFWNQI